MNSTYPNNPTPLIAVLEATLNNVADGILVVGLDRQILYINAQFAEMWGIDPTIDSSAEALAIAFPQTADPHTFQQRLEEIYAAVHEDSYDLIHLKDGRVLERHSKPLHFADNTLGRVWTYRDITDKIQAQEALKASERNYRELLAAERRHVQETRLLDRVRSALGQELDLAVVFRTVVTAVVETFKYSLVSVYLREDNLLKLQYQIGYDQVISEVPISQSVSGEVVRTGRPILLEDVTTHPHFLEAIAGIVSEVCVPLFDHGTPVGVINVETKSSEPPLTAKDLNMMIALGEHISVAINRARLHTTVREQEAQYRQLFELAPIGMGIADRTGKLVYTNQAYADTVGYPLAELTHMNLKDLTHPDDLETNFDLIGQLFAGEVDTYGFEKRYVRKDGRVVNAFLRVTRMPSVTGDEQYMVAQLIDLTERKEAEELLRHTQKMESLGIMAGGIAHDFNNLLVAMLGQTSLALRKLPDSHPARSHIQKGVKAAERAAELTQQLLAYSGRGQFAITTFNLNQLVNENHHLFEVAIPKNVSIICHLDPQLPPIEADKGQIQQVIMNLILNAAEAMGKHGGNITITTWQEPINPDGNQPEDKQASWQFVSSTLPTGPYVTLQVCDNGCGMSEETIVRIFDPFFTTKFTGRGLGLAAVLGIVRGHKGALYVNSQINVGTTFKILFPIQPED